MSCPRPGCPGPLVIKSCSIRNGVETRTLRCAHCRLSTISRGKPAEENTTP
jgi:hypothetical protein